ncbi:sulfotransferase [Marinoscillum sp. 108]|uniref:Sulfotransferase n=1 Tax=Marinoscillum luteum TaxID=861051 RepID=A0ABW7NE62_9BACT|nr:sulfotransferase [Marinoscillum sp. 108]VXD20493.1 conserved hypothetical protein [Marinoscillum sp. 108]
MFGRYSQARKIFCVGLNKTGTTSLKFALGELGFKVGDEEKAKGLLDSWAMRDFRPIVKYCKSAEAFQDSPFSFPYTYVALDQAFPGSKFILTERDDPDQWVSSLINFHGKLWANGQTPTKEHLQAAFNSSPGRPWKVNRLLFDTPESDPYNREILIRFYNEYNRGIKDYFKERKMDLLVINLNDKSSYNKFCSFLSVNPVREVFPKLNSSH